MSEVNVKFEWNGFTIESTDERTGYMSKDHHTYDLDRFGWGWNEHQVLDPYSTYRSRNRKAMAMNK